MQLTRWIKNIASSTLLRLAGPFVRSQYDLARSKFPEQRFETILIYGRPSFVEYVSDALRALKAGYPYGYSLVRRYIRAIVDSDRVTGLLDGIRYEQVGPTGRHAIPPERYAALLVRQAIAQRIVWEVGMAKSSRSLLLSWQKELDTMRLLQCDPKYFHPQQNRILKLKRQLGK